VVPVDVLVPAVTDEELSVVASARLLTAKRRGKVKVSGNLSVPLEDKSADITGRPKSSTAGPFEGKLAGATRLPAPSMSDPVSKDVVGFVARKALQKSTLNPGRIPLITVLACTFGEKAPTIMKMRHEKKDTLKRFTSKRT
jgi:hypothetical protein